jgi:serine/threonine-protein phosphatase 2A regulatory subunit B''
MKFSVCSEIKVKEFFTGWLTEDSTVPVFEAVQATATALLKGELLDFDFSVFAVHEPDTSSPVPVGPPVSPSMRSLPDLHGRNPQELREFLPISGTEIPSFYGPTNVHDEEAALADALDLAPDKVRGLFERFCQLPGCFADVFLSLKTFASQGFEAFWRTHLLGRDPNHRLLRIIAGPESQKLLPTDLDPFVHALALVHPSLEFVKDQPQFFEKYVAFVITRLFFTVDPELRGSLGIHQMRKHNLAGISWSAVRMADLNEIHSLFGYQHFSVSYCKFWELDLDCDGLLS